MSPRCAGVAFVILVLLAPHGSHALETTMTAQRCSSSFRFWSWQGGSSPARSPARRGLTWNDGIIAASPDLCWQPSLPPLDAAAIARRRNESSADRRGQNLSQCGSC